MGELGEAGGQDSELEGAQLVRRRRSSGELKETQMKFYSPDSQIVLREAKLWYKMYLMTYNAFPAPVDKLKMVIDAYNTSWVNNNSPSSESLSAFPPHLPDPLSGAQISLGRRQLVSGPYPPVHEEVS